MFSLAIRIWCAPPKYLKNGEFEKSQNRSEHGATVNSTMVAHSTTKVPCTYPYSGIQIEASGRWASKSGCVNTATNHTGATVSRSGHLGRKKNSSPGWESDSTFLSRSPQLHWMAYSVHTLNKYKYCMQTENCFEYFLVYIFYCTRKSNVASVVHTTYCYTVASQVIFVLFF